MTVHDISSSGGDLITGTADATRIRFFTYDPGASNNPVSGYSGTIINIPTHNAGGSIRFLISESGKVYIAVFKSGVSWGSWVQLH